MNAFFRYIKEDKILSYGFILSFLAIILSFLIVLFFYRSLPPLIPLYNQFPFGQSMLGATPEIFIHIGLALAILIINIVFSELLYIKTPLIARMLCITSVLVSLFALLFTIRTLQLVV